MLLIIGHASRALVPGYSLSASTVKASEGTLITPSMVGLRVGGRKGFRGFRLTTKQ
ncbi:hypothetical protein D3C87_2152590 [compost metagenome]